MNKYNDTESLLLLDGEEKFELGGKFLLAIETVRKVDPTNTTIGMDCNSECLDIVAAIGASGEV